MADTFTHEERSKIMLQVKSIGNKSTELKLISLFKAHKIIGWRRNYKIFGKPDFVFPKKKIAIFVDGCFWHGHNCRNTSPEDNKAYWVKKISKNISRDKEVSERLMSLGWTVIRIWECELKNPKILDDKIFNCV
jgi:DNA mismatch endonuclease, patch repair protein